MKPIPVKTINIIMLFVFSLLILFFIYWAFAFPEDKWIAVFLAVVGFFGLKKYFKKIKAVKGDKNA